jgi:hypothetical protein
LQEIEAEFDKHVSVKDITQHMDVDPESRQYIYNYWKLKRKVRYLALAFKSNFEIKERMNMGSGISNILPAPPSHLSHCISTSCLHLLLVINFKKIYFLLEVHNIAGLEYE